MSDEILQGIAQDLVEVDAAIDTAEDLVNALKEAGEDVREMELHVRELKTRKTKWQRMLEGRGISAGPRPA